MRSYARFYYDLQSQPVKLVKLSTLEWHIRARARSIPLLCASKIRLTPGTFSCVDTPWLRGDCQLNLNVARIQVLLHPLINAWHLQLGSEQLVLGFAKDSCSFWAMLNGEPGYRTLYVIPLPAHTIRPHSQELPARGCFSSINIFFRIDNYVLWPQITCSHSKTHAVPTMLKEPTATWFKINCTLTTRVNHVFELVDYESMSDFIPAESSEQWGLYVSTILFLLF